MYMLFNWAMRSSYDILLYSSSTRCSILTDFLQPANNTAMHMMGNAINIMFILVLYFISLEFGIYVIISNA